MKKPWLFRVYRGWNTTQLYGDYFISHEIGISINQPGFHGVSAKGFGSRTTIWVQGLDDFKIPQKK